MTDDDDDDVRFSFLPFSHPGSSVLGDRGYVYVSSLEIFWFCFEQKAVLAWICFVVWGTRINVCRHTWMCICTFHAHDTALIRLDQLGILCLGSPHVHTDGICERKYVHERARGQCDDRPARQCTAMLVSTPKAMRASMLLAECDA